MRNVRRLLPLLALLSFALHTGCALVSKPPAGPPGESLRSRELLDPGLLSLRVEIDHIEGSVPRPRALKIYEDRLAFYTDKPDGFDLVLDDAIAEEEWEGTKTSITEIVRAHSDERLHTGAYLYALYAPAMKRYRGYSFRPGKLAQDIDFPVIVIFADQLRPVAWVTGVRQEASVLVHETGHVFGLVTDDGHRDDGHCTNGWCLMYDGVDARSLAVHAIPTLFTGYLPTHFCRDCRADLWGTDPVPGMRGLRGYPTAERPGCYPERAPLFPQPQNEDDDEEGAP